MNVPIWGIFEIITLGEFGAFFNCLNYNLRSSISRELGLHQPSDTDGFLTKKIIFAIKELRNAVAHNNGIFDTRFSRSKIDSAVSNSLVNATGIQNITFKNITDANQGLKSAKVWPDNLAISKKHLLYARNE